MIKAQRQIPDRIGDIREAIGNARSDIGSLNRDQFLADTKTQRAVIEGIIVIGEAANNIMRLDPTLETRRPELWKHLRDSYDMRILPTHEYFRVDPTIIWDTIHNDFPKLDSLLDRV
jgi:uncharacterized protein with HEPN domain